MSHDAVPSSVPASTGGAPPGGSPPGDGWSLTGFGDEIDADPEVQLAVLAALGASHVEVRSAWGTNVVELDADALTRLAELVGRRGMAVSAIASPIGKVDVDAPVEAELSRLDAALEAARVLQARYVRVFSFYRAPDRSPADVRDRVLAHLAALTRRAAEAGVVLLHENEKDIYGDVPERVLDLVESVGSPHLRLAWDAANFVQCDVHRPFDEGFALLREHVEYLHVKDALAATGEVVPAGEGDGQLRETLTALRDSGWTGFTSLEPHLTVAGQLGGFSGPSEFGRAARAFTSLTTDLGVTLR